MLNLIFVQRSKFQCARRKARCQPCAWPETQDDPGTEWAHDTNLGRQEIGTERPHRTHEVSSETVRKFLTVTWVCLNIGHLPLGVPESNAWTEIIAAGSSLLFIPKS